MSVCNIFKNIESGKSTFYTFSEYTNDLPRVGNSNDISVDPSGFVCLNLNFTYKWKEVTPESGTESEYKEDSWVETPLDIDIKAKHENKYYISVVDDKLIDAIQNYYENLSCCLRDSNTESKDYKKYLFGGLLKRLKEDGFASDYNNVMLKDIDIHSSGVHDGMTYKEILCYLSPNDTKNTAIDISGSGMSITNNDTYLKGYSGVTGKNTAKTGTFSFPEAECGEPGSESTDTYVEFNCIIVLYDLKIGDSEYNNIPLGIYINDPSEDPIKKYVKSDTIYDQGTSYALRVCMRFANTSDGSNVSEVTVDNNDECIIPLVDSFTQSLSKMDKLISSFEDYRDYASNRINAYFAN